MLTRSIYFMVPLLFCLFTNSAIADVQLTIKNAAGIEGKVSFSKKRARLNSGLKNNSYLLLHYSKEEITLVDSTRKQAAKGYLGNIQNASNTDHLVVSLEKKGKGPKIEGYKTKEYLVKLNENPCGTVFLAKKLLKKKEVKRYLGMIEKMPPQSHYALSQYNGMAGDCMVLGNKLAALYSKKGFPLKTLNTRGDVVSEVIKVKAKKDIKSSYYKIPDGYQVAEGTAQKSRQQARGEEKTDDALDSDNDITDDIEDAEENLASADDDLKKKLKEKRDKKKEKLKEKLNSLFD